MEGIATIVITLIGLYLLYRIGLVDFAQRNMDRASGIADRAMETQDFKSREKHSRELGKIAKKMSDDNINRSSATALNAMFANLDEVKSTEG